MNEQPIPDLSFRQGRLEDWPPVAQIVAHTWDDGDYITESVWRRWAADSNGQLIVAVHDGQIVGFARVARVGPAEWWMEGLRVDPERRRLGIARALTVQTLRWFREHGDGIVRLTVFSENEPSKRLVHSFGFRHTLSFKAVETPARPGDYRSLKLMGPTNLDLVMRYLRRSPIYRVNHFAENEWHLYYLTRDRVASYLQDPEVEVLGWRQMDTLNGLVVLFKAPPEGYKSESSALRAGYIDAPDDTTLRAMLAALRGLAARRGHECVAWNMPLGIGLERLVAEGEVEQLWDGEMTLWELPLKTAIDSDL